MKVLFNCSIYESNIILEPENEEDQKYLDETFKFETDKDKTDDVGYAEPQYGNNWFGKAVRKRGNQVIIEVGDADWNYDE